MIYGVTGHRPDKLGGYSGDAAERMREKLTALFEERFNDDAERVLTGMALGVDTIAAQVWSSVRIRPLQLDQINGDWSPLFQVLAPSLLGPQAFVSVHQDLDHHQHPTIVRTHEPRAVPVYLALDEAELVDAAVALLRSAGRTVDQEHAPMCEYPTVRRATPDHGDLLAHDLGLGAFHPLTFCGGGGGGNVGGRLNRNAGSIFGTKETYPHEQRISPTGPVKRSRPRHVELFS